MRTRKEEEWLRHEEKLQELGKRSGKQNNKSGLNEEGAKKEPGSWGGAYGKRQIKPGTGGRM